MHMAIARQCRGNDLYQSRRRTRRYSYLAVGSTGRQRLRDNQFVRLVCSRPTGGEEPTVPSDSNHSSAPEQPLSNPSTPQEGQERASRLAVAVVDDDDAVCDSTRILLEVLNFEVHTYANAAEFLAASPNVACVIADYHMPGLNGVELTAELRNRGNTVPVIIITAMSDPQIEADAAKLGVKSVLRKPLGRALVTVLQSELG
jgi:CheY-like chemotaxis protein